ncbi:uncharacterized protein A1O9_07552 [Exophiala aquamarina CBS 119918]|uniref:Auxin efflux carrier n=1 Tax=Exophiala aquamarina CBS 119918 TaxID=1182545 RepID=A0A072P888_9EURO|nr:uncharacterized protein A1O9_07552 [Exophiala aquamarina CBS 119918]KEF55972.1 hypothetical protein A1O9_07552 [Exophiala aquamarina CBS 119918]
MSDNFLSSFLGALQASLSVLLVIFYGVIASQYKLLDGPSAKKISAACVRLFLPALLITRVGSELQAGTGTRYIPILIWAILYSQVSIGIGLLAVKFWKFPAWVTPAVAFNNTTSLPLLLIESLSSTGILDRLLLDGDSTEEAINRAQSYFLVCAIVGNCFTFAIGPRLIDSENAPGNDKDSDDGSDANDRNQDGDDAERGSINDDELTSLLPHRVRKAGGATHKRIFFIGNQKWEKLSPRTQDVLVFLFDFLNAPLLGAVLGAIIGLTPPLHRAFFNDSNDGGFLNAWLTSSLKKIGELFVTLQVVVVGVSLSSSLRKMKRGEDNGLPLLPTALVLLVRLVLWPVISIAVVWLLATKTNTLQQDPILWFTMMLMPTGPPAMKLIAMAEVNGAGEDDKMVISKVLTLAYACSPLLALTVVGSLYSSEAAIRL